MSNNYAPNPEVLDRSLKEKCSSGNVSPDVAHYFFYCVIHMQPAFHVILHYFVYCSCQE
ncbi:hypothetical protein ACOSQ3_004636 [Xanthoceras sorbifolium]